MVLFFHYIKAILQARYNVLNIILVPDIGSQKSAIDSYHRSLTLFRYFSIAPVETGKEILIPSRFSIQQNLKVKNQVEGLILNHSAEVLLVFDIAAAAIVESIKIDKKILWLGDLNFQSGWYHFMYALREDWRKHRWWPYALAQRVAWKRLYKRLIPEYEICIVASKSSEAALAKLDIRATFLPYPWSNEGAVDRDYKRIRPSTPTFLFFGNLVGLGSRSSLHFLFSELYPRLLAHWGPNGFHIIIGGSDELPNWVSRIIDQYQEIEFIGFIRDLTKRISDVHAVLVPIDVPVGNRSRILTAQAKRGLVVTHRNAALGNSFLLHGKNCLLADSADEFLACMVESVENDIESLRIIDQAENSYLDHYSPEIATKYLLDIVAS